MSSISENLDFGKIPPQAVDIEEAVLSALMIDEKAYFEVSEMLIPDVFYNQSHQFIYAAIEQLQKDGKKVDLLTISDQLKKNEQLEQVGGMVYITQLSNKVATSSHIEEHARIIYEKYLLRSLVMISHNVATQCFQDIDPDEIIHKLSHKVNTLRKDLVNSLVLVGMIGNERLNELAKINESDNEIIGLDTGFRKLNWITSGWQRTDLIIIAARPSMGKTMIAISLAMKPAIQGKTVILFSLEMSRGQLYDRILSFQTGYENSFIRRGKFTNDQWQRIEWAQGEIEKMNLIIDDTPGLTNSDMRAKIMQQRLKTDIDLVIVDYLQLMRTKEKHSNREGDISDISRSLKLIAKENNVPVIALSQLNRQVETRADKRPQLSDLRESGAIEQDADVVSFIYRPEFYGIDSFEDGTLTKNVIQLLFAKHRNGPVGDISIYRTENWSAIYEHQDTVINEQNELEF